MIGLEWATPDWFADAACRSLGPALFHPLDLSADSVAPALAICAECPVVAECRVYGDRVRLEGVYGGGSARDRRRRGRSKGPQPCGTRSAYVRHTVHGEQPCEACSAASAEYHAVRYARRVS